MADIVNADTLRKNSQGANSVHEKTMILNHLLMQASHAGFTHTHYDTRNMTGEDRKTLLEKVAAAGITVDDANKTGMWILRWK